VNVHYLFYKDGSPVGNVVTETIDSIKANTDTVYVFNTPVDLSSAGEYYFRTWFDASNYDYTPYNNKIWSLHYVLKEIKPGDYFHEHFEGLTSEVRRFSQCMA